MTQKVTIIGAGSTYFTRKLVVDLIARNEEMELAMVDIDPQSVEMAARLSRKMIEIKRAPIKVSASVDRRDVLPGATAVISTIAVGGRRAWEQDVAISRKYDIYHPGGDTCMPAGTARSLRVVPPAIAIARDVLDLAPQALYFNYSNPMAVVCTAIHRYTDANVIGLCTGVPEVAAGLARLLGTTPSRMRYTAVGINHLTWFTEVRVDGQDAFPRLREIGRANVARAKELAASVDDSSGAETARRQLRELHPFCWQLFLLLGAFPCPNDGHVVEFFPHLFRGKKSYYGMTLGLESDKHRARWERVYAQMQEEASSDRPLPDDYCERVPGGREHVIDIIYSIRRDDCAIYSASLPNRGHIPNLPVGCVPESPAVATSAGLRPLAQPPLPAGIVGTLATRFQWVDTVIEAAVEGSRDKAIQAMILDGAVSSYEMAEDLTDELLVAHADHLPQFSGQASRQRA